MQSPLNMSKITRHTVSMGTTAGIKFRGVEHSSCCDIPALCPGGETEIAGSDRSEISRLYIGYIIACAFNCLQIDGNNISTYFQGESMSSRSVKNAVVVEYQKRRKPTKHYVCIVAKITSLVLRFVLIMFFSI